MWTAAASDPAAGVSLITAVFVGLISFLSPCVLPLVPAYLLAVQDDGSRGRQFRNAVLFIACFSVVFVVLGASAGIAGGALAEHRGTLEIIAGALIMAFGALYLGSLWQPQLATDWHPLAQRARHGGPAVMGFAFAVAWTPCVGPTLAAILSSAALAGSGLHGAVLLLAYSGGLAIPFLVVAVGYDRLTRMLALFKRHPRAITAVGGVVLVGYGALVVSGQLFWLNVEAERLLRGLGLDWLYRL